jgi:hypothetical protein
VLHNGSDRCVCSHARAGVKPSSPRPRVISPTNCRSHITPATSGSWKSIASTSRPARARSSRQMTGRGLFTDTRLQVQAPRRQQRCRISPARGWRRMRAVHADRRAACHHRYGYLLCGKIAQVNACVSTNVVGGHRIKLTSDFRAVRTKTEAPAWLVLCVNDPSPNCGVNTSLTK